MAILPEIRTARLLLRPLVLEDAPFVLRLLNEPSFLSNIGDRGVRNLDDVPRYLEAGPFRMYRQSGLGLMHVSRLEDRAELGMCGLLKRDDLPAPDIGYAFFPAYWGLGYAFEAAEAALRANVARHRLPRVLGVVSQGNSGSIRVLEKLGMRFERMHRMQQDEPEVLLYSRDFSGA